MTPHHAMTLPWPPSAEDLLRRLYPNNHPTVLAGIFARSPGAIHAQAARMGLLRWNAGK